MNYDRNDFNCEVDFSNPGHLKLCLLSQGLNLENELFFQSKEFAENQFQYGYSSEFVKKFENIPAEIILPQEVIVGIHLKKGSPWSLKTESKDGKTCLIYKKHKITEVSFVPKPYFYGKKLSNGISAEKAAVMYGPHILSIFSRGWCYYFQQKKQCKFCSLSPTRKSLGSENVVSLSTDLAEEVVKLALSHNRKDICYINYSSGSYSDNDAGIISQVEILRRIEKTVPKKVKQHMLTMPPNNPKLIKDLLEAGLDSINFAIEVFDEKLFKKVCPGKQKFYGYEKFLKILKEASLIFPKNKVYVNLVGGLEPLDSMCRAFSYFSEIGITPSVNVFHPDPKSDFSKMPVPSVEYLMKMAKNMSATYFEKGFEAIFKKGGTRNSIDTEVFKGFYK